MSDCEFLDKCPFFNDQLSDMPSMSVLFKKRYCRDDWASCARYMVRTQSGADQMPANLWPNQEDKARQIIEQAKA